MRIEVRVLADDGTPVYAIEARPGHRVELKFWPGELVVGDQHVTRLVIGSSVIRPNLLHDACPSCSNLLGNLWTTSGDVLHCGKCGWARRDEGLPAPDVTV